MKGVEIFIRGTVQGVGFRPFIYNLAREHKLVGTVCNTGDGVVIHTNCSSNELDDFTKAIENRKPPLSRITSITCKPTDTPLSATEFVISKSSGSSSADASIPPDIALCDDCLREMLDSSDPRYDYPFINCTNCGPRFTIVKKIPYDRPYTSMKNFPMCPACLSDYQDPGNRRFHAQPNACPNCGPQVSWHDQGGEEITSQSPLADCAQALAEGKLVAIKGLGGFHLACSALNSTAINLLRTRKTRPAKPLAIMVKDRETAHQLCQISSKEEELLLSIEHPIVLLQKKEQQLADGLAPGLNELGVMLPYTPLHHLLFQKEGCPKALVMTSGNSSGTPICIDNQEAIKRLSGYVDNFLLHNRDIVTRIDDSVTRVTGDNPLILRRARGYVPSPIQSKWKLPPIIGCGAGLKSTFCLGKNHSLFTSQHIGDLDNLEAYDFFQESVQHLKDVFQIEPEAVACDLHPDYLSSQFAKSLGLPLYPIQHHHAHATAVMAEHGLEQPVIAVILDGTGFGPDGTIWGGEILQAELTSYKRVGHLSHLALPGGDAAAKEPWRMALSALYSIAGPDIELPVSMPAPESFKQQSILSMLEKGFNSPLSSSCGRLFDAVSSLLGLCQTMSYEGEAAMLLEDCARRSLNSSWKNDLLSSDSKAKAFELDASSRTWEIDSNVLIKQVLSGISHGKKCSEIAGEFHLLLIQNIAKLVQKLCIETGLNQVVLTGGCMQNAIILEGLRHLLASYNISVFTGENIPINDGGISLGQTLTGGLQHVSRNSHEGN